MKFQYWRGLALCAVQSLSYATEITGIWKAIDDKTGYARADVEISKLNDGSYNGKVVRIHAIPNRPANTYCSKCTGALKDVPILGLSVLSGLKPDPHKKNEFINGSILDPLTGNVYKSKAKLNSRGNVLTLRGYVGTPILGRTVSWVKVH
ncbi:signal peptidase [Acinetobacter sp. LoGeW2-3]|uniref:DUF2147 domain-containing protein n=1 Tax=Acinetobacter sp. LoGeW2-3 TaxID=1808001 RepID=UPI000C059AB5|nr:DUF2147 domain-containing protein [Acinetobacter sp. LoGeW2-3]ATO18857.1 signal peptidase [Acinetobacter sp. LoGeW2-3]